MKHSLLFALIFVCLGRCGLGLITVREGYSQWEQLVKVENILHSYEERRQMFVAIVQSFADNRNQITLNEFKLGMKVTHTQNNLPLPDNTQLKLLFKTMDLNLNNHLDKDEFILGIQNHVKHGVKIIWNNILTKDKGELIPINHRYAVYLKRLLNKIRTATKNRINYFDDALKAIDHEFAENFAAADSNNDSFLEPKEVKKVLDAFIGDNKLPTYNYTQLMNIIKKYDINGDQKLSKDEAYQFYKSTFTQMKEELFEISKKLSDKFNAALKLKYKIRKAEESKFGEIEGSKFGEIGGVQQLIDYIKEYMEFSIAII